MLSEPVMQPGCVGSVCVARRNCFCWEYVCLMQYSKTHAHQFHLSLQSSCKCIMDSNESVVAALQTVLTSPHLKSITENTGAVPQPLHCFVQCT